MNVLVASADIAIGRELSRMLTHAGYALEVATTGDTALALLTAKPFDIFVCDAGLTAPDASEIISKVRAEVKDHPFVLLLSDGTRATRKGPADDYVRKPINVLDLLERIADGMQRRSASAKAGSALSKGEGLPRSILATSAWAELIKSAGLVLGKSTGLEFVYEQPTGRESGLIWSAAAFMVDVVRLIEVACGLFVNKTSAVELAQKMNVKSGESTTRELLGQLGNDLLDHLRVALRRDGFQFTVGLGQPEGMPTASGFRRCFSASSVMAFTGGGAHVKVVVGARPALKVSVPGRKLREDMVIASDFNGDDGSTLVTAGTRLTASTIERLMPHLSRGLVQVCTPASKW